MLKIRGYSGYFITKEGAAWTKKTYSLNPKGKLKLLRVYDNGNGYLKITLYKKGKPKQVYIHRLVARQFIKNPDKKKYINHKDGDKKNNNVSNLEYCTHSENMLHAFASGLNKPSHQKPLYQFDPDNRLIAEFSSIQEASKITGINRGNINTVCLGIRQTAGKYIWRYKETST